MICKKQFKNKIIYNKKVKNNKLIIKIKKLKNQFNCEKIVFGILNKKIKNYVQNNLKS